MCGGLTSWVPNRLISVKSEDTQLSAQGVNTIKPGILHLSLLRSHWRIHNELLMIKYAWIPMGWNLVAQDLFFIITVPAFRQTEKTPLLGLYCVTFGTTIYQTRWRHLIIMSSQSIGFWIMQLTSMDFLCKPLLTGHIIYLPLLLMIIGYWESFCTFGIFQTFLLLST